MVQFSLHPGRPLPLGIHKSEKGLNFALVAPEAGKVVLCLFALDNSSERLEIPLEPHINCTDQTWHIEVEGLQQPFAYGYKINDESLVLLDPYAKGIHTHRQGYGTNPDHFYSPLGTVSEEPFDWQGVASPKIRPEELILYEMHLRGFTQHTSSAVAHPGTYLGMIEKIPHLVELGVNAIELMPVFEYDELECHRCSIIGGKLLGNYWGYSTVNFFSPMERYAYGTDASTELKTLVRELHRAGIAVVLDVVYNHTAEGNHLGPIYSFKKLANDRYYIMNPDGTYQNHSGCGNTFNANHPLTQQLIVDSLRHWITEFHVDGFRFDLASALTRNEDGVPLPHAPLLQKISNDPTLSSAILIAEPWDMGLYQVGSFYNMTEGRWAEWNGRYRDTLRRFFAGHGNTSGEFATRLCGSQDLYWQASPLSSVNFITSHDGFTLYDLVSYNIKHNEGNGEGNRDGLNENLSWNCGEEGPTQDAVILQRRQRQMRNLLLALMLSQGIPMLTMGDEYAHTKVGNNNPWAWDEELNWFRWDQLASPEGQRLKQFIAKLTSLRRSHPSLTRGRFLTDRDIVWHGLQPNQPDWGPENRFVAFTLHGEQDLYVAFNSSQNEVEVTLPTGHWEWCINTADDNPSPVPGSTIKMIERSAIVLALL